MCRVVTLLNQTAITLDNSAELQAQVDAALKEVKQHQEKEQMFKEVSFHRIFFGLFVSVVI